MTATRVAIGTWAVATLIAGILLASTWSAAAELPISPRLIPTFRLEGFAPGVAVTQTVTAARNGLSRIDIGIAPSGQPSTIEAVVRTADGVVVTRQRFELDASPTRGEARLSFVPLTDSAGQTFVIEVRGTDKAASFALEGVSADGLRDGQLIDPHRSLAETRQLDMNVRLYQSRTFGEALGEFVRTERPATLVAAGLSATVLLAGAAAILKVTQARLSIALGLAASVYAAVAFAAVRFVIGFG